ncbi:MAG: universal stress protein [Alphaproteobacteria bacterium]|nr:universal stress protein [Alphaproteobacteria bacterium]
MAYRVVLVPVMGDAADQAALDMARSLGERMNTHIVGLHVRTPLATLISAGMFDPAPMPAQVINRIEEEIRAGAAAARDKFDKWRKAAGIDTATSPGRLAKASAEWVDVEAPLADEIATRARTADLVVLARSAREYASASDDALHGALFNSGRPALIVPGNVPSGPFETVVIAWNDSRESAHAVAAAWSLIGRAKRVVVFIGAADEDRRRAADRFVTHLAWRGYPTAAIATDESDDVGEALLDAAQREKAGLIITGAYTHSRLRQFVFGGVTNHLLAKATIPVLMAH